MVSARSNESANCVTRWGGALITTYSASGIGANAGRVVVGVQAPSSRANAQAPRTTHDARISASAAACLARLCAVPWPWSYPFSWYRPRHRHAMHRSEEHTSELQSRGHLVCRLLLEKKKRKSWKFRTIDVRKKRQRT